MIKSDFNVRMGKELSTQRKGSKNNKSKSKSNKKQKPANKGSATKMKKTDEFKTNNGITTLRGMLKQNQRINQNTPKKQKISNQNYIEDDRFSDIKFISKQCSSIKEKQNDGCISFSNSGNNLDQFSPLFDKIQTNSKQDFTLEIYAIQDLESYHRIKSNRQIDAGRQIKKEQKLGKIRKNKTNGTIVTQGQQSKPLQMDIKILQIFNLLDNSCLGVLTKQNCCCERLTTQMNYLIGSILNKIKVRGKQYNYKQFECEFKTLIDELQHEEVLQILNNQKKKSKNDQNIKCVTISEISNQIRNQNKQMPSPQFKACPKKQQEIQQKLNKIKNKLDSYFAKNKLRLPQIPQLQQINCDQNPSDTYRGKQQGKSIIKDQPCKLKSSKTSDKTLATENSQTNSMHIDGSTRYSSKGVVEIIKRNDGSAFELHFEQLHKHLD